MANLVLKKMHKGLRMDFYCEICGDGFYKKCYLKAHEKRKHKICHRRNIRNESFACKYCEKTYGSKSSLYKHSKLSHQLERTFNVLCQEQECHEKFANVNGLRDHLSSHHNLEGFSESNDLQFSNEADFYEWLAEEEEKTNSRFVCSNGKKKVQNQNSFTYYMFTCNRSGVRKSTNKGKRPRKSPGTIKIGFHCTSCMIVRSHDTHLTVKYYPKHYNHDFIIHDTLNLNAENKRISGPRKDQIWVYFDAKVQDGNKRCRAVCKSCGKEMLGQVARLKRHVSICTRVSLSENEDVDYLHSNGAQSATDGHTDSDKNSQCLPNPSNSKHKLDFPEPEKNKKLKTSSSFAVRASSSRKEIIDCQVAKYIYSTNTSFQSVESHHFKKLMKMLRPGYTPPSKSDLGGNLLNKVYEIEMESCRNDLKNQTLCMSLDGWSNAHNQPQPVVYICVTTVEGNVYLVDTIDTSKTPRTRENLKNLVVAAIKNTQHKFDCRIRSFVTDNATSMVNITKALEVEAEDCIDVVCYGCSGHILNLLAKDLDIPGVTEHVLQIIRYFRTNQLARAKFNESKGRNGVELSLPLKVQWNTICDSLESYITHWPILMQIVDENKGLFDEVIASNLMNMSIKKNVEVLLLRLKPILIALDKIQRDSCSIAEAVDVWKKLETDLKENEEPSSCKKSVVNKLFKNRYDQALKPVHFLAYLLSPAFQPRNLSTEEKNKAMEFVKEHYNDTSLMAILLKFVARAEPFNEPVVEDEVIKEMNAMQWWKSVATLKNCIPLKELLAIEQLMTAKATIAGVEKKFSAHGFNHTKFRNQLGVEKTAKLAFLFKSLNK